MPHTLISHLQAGDAVQQFFLVRQADSSTTKDGKPYLSLVLGDKSGSIVAKVWNDILKKCPGPFAVADFVGVKGQVDSYKQELQINVKYLETEASIRSRGGDLSAFDPELLIQATPYHRQTLWQELWQLAETEIRPPLGPLVLTVLDRYREEFLVCPAAVRYHHPYLGGLLEHTWFVTRHALASLVIYPELNRDLVLAGAILHDLGKIKELANPPAPERTVPGHLLGHVVLGWEMVRAAARGLEFPDPTLLVQLEHILLSHHGTMEFGSPVVPKTREALLVNFLDDLDAKLKMMSQHLESDTGEGHFTGYNRALQRDLYKGGPAPDPEPEPDSEPDSEK
jgi:3'-5' exoribonuclease